MERLHEARSAVGSPGEPMPARRFRLRFRERDLEAAFERQSFDHNLVNLRFAFLTGIGLWLMWGVFLRGHLLSIDDQRLDVVMRYGAFIPLLVAGLGLSFAGFFRRVWEWVVVASAVATLLLWIYYAAHIVTLPTEFGYVGVILITSFTYTLLRLRFFLVVGVIAIGIGTYLGYAYSDASMPAVTRALATLYLISFGGLGGIAAYRMELFRRRLFLRERQLDRERQRSDGLLLNILPRVIVDRLKTSSGGGRMAEQFEQVSVVFADAVGSTEQATRCSADEFTATLDELFRRFDRVVDRHGLEKIKTVGDGYLAVAGAPVRVADPAGAAVATAMQMVAESPQVRWPSGDPVELRVGVATGPAVAGVIGERKFAYDVWGDTVNLASRLQQIGEPGRVLVSAATAGEVEDRYELSDPLVLNLKGKGPTPARFLIRARADEPALEESAGSRRR
jgi:class 3 adenylate cyclase